MNISDILFVDIETVPQSEKYPADQLGELFNKRYQKQINEELDRLYHPDNKDTAKQALNSIWKEKAAFHAEFGKICCISIGKLKKGKFIVKSITGRKQKEILIKFTESLIKSECTHLCAHNGLEFDYRFLAQAYIIEGLPLPEILNTHFKKPWDVNLLDTLKMWGGTTWNYKASLDLICAVLGIPSPKTDIDGSMVADIFYGSYKVESDELPFDKEEAALGAIGKYCAGDVVAEYKVFCRITGNEIVSEENIEIL